MSTQDPETAAIQAFFAAMTEADAPDRIRDDLPGYLAAHGVAAADREHIAQHQAQLLVYRAMVHSRLRGVIAEYLPRTLAALGKPRLRSEVAAFIAEQAPRSVYFRRVPHEFLAWAAPRWRLDASTPAYLVDLARHELLDPEVSDCVGGGEAASDQPLALDHPVALDGSVRLAHYAFSVHRDADPPAPEPTALLAYRDRDNQRVRLLELTPRAAALCTRLLHNEPLQAALVGACEDIDETLSDEYLAAMASLLADLGERGVLLGAAPAD